MLQYDSHCSPVKQWTVLDSRENETRNNQPNRDMTEVDSNPQAEKRNGNEGKTTRQTVILFVVAKSHNKSSSLPRHTRFNSFRDGCLCIDCLSPYCNKVWFEPGADTTGRVRCIAHCSGTKSSLLRPATKCTNHHNRAYQRY